MATATTYTAVLTSTQAGFDAWYNEIMAQFLAVGLLQLATTSTVTLTSTPLAHATSGTLTAVWPYASCTQSCTIGGNSIPATISFTYNSTAVTFPDIGGTAPNSATVTLGLYDTGQIANNAAIPAANAAAGYAIYAFTDTLQATAPVYIKFEFGIAAANTDPQMWVTVGTAHTNGSGGSVTGTAPYGARHACFNGGTYLSGTTNYLSYFCYNPTYGVLWFASKVGGYSATYPGVGLGGFFMARSNSSTGAATGDAITSISNSSSVSGGTSGNGYMECLSYLTSVGYGATIGAPAPTASTIFCFAPLLAAAIPTDSTNYASQTQCFPVFYMTPTYAISAYIAGGLQVDFIPGATYSVAIVGSTALTFLVLSNIWGSISSVVNTGAGTLNAASQGDMLVLWQ